MHKRLKVALVVCAVIVMILLFTTMVNGGGTCSKGVIIRGPFGCLMYCFPKGQELIVLNFGGDEASFSIFTDTSTYKDDLDVTSYGGFAGYQISGVASMDRRIDFFDSGKLTAITDLGETLASIEFSGSGFISESFNTDAAYDEDFAYIWVDLEYAGVMWIQVVDGIPVPVPAPPVRRPRLHVSSVAVPAGAGGADGSFPVLVTVINTGSAPLNGEATATAGLSYGDDWVPESVTEFCKTSLGNGTIEPGESYTFTIDLPAIPVEVLDTFRKRKAFYTSYTDPDPDQDYIGITVSIGGLDTFAFVPMPGVGPTLSGRKAKAN